MSDDLLLVVAVMNFNEPVDPSSVAITDLQLSGVPGSTVTAVSVINGDMTSGFSVAIRRRMRSQ